MKLGNFHNFVFDVLLASLLLVSLSEQAGSTCYYPDSSVALDFNYTTCNLNSPAGFSSCCYLGEGDVCLSDGLCYWPVQPDGHGNYIYRGACTDKSWTDSACAQVCTVDDPNHFETVSFCPNTTDFCCAKSVDGDCCQYANLRFNLTIPAYILAALQNGTVTAEPNGFDPGSTAVSSGGSSGGTSPTHSATTSSHSGISAGAAAGITIAVVVVVAIAVGVVIYCRRRYLSRRKPEDFHTDYNKPDVESKSMVEGVEVMTASVHSKPFDKVTENESRRGSRRESSTVSSPHSCMALNQAPTNTYSKEGGDPIAEDDEPTDAIREANDGVQTPERQFLDEGHLGGGRFDPWDGTSTGNSYISAT